MSAVRRHDGFTLIELVACIVIIGVLAAIAGPRFFDNQAFTERGYAAEIVSALRSARQVAVASSCEVRVTIDPVAGYQAMQRAAAGNTCAVGGAWSVPVLLTDGSVLAGTPPSGVVLNPAANITFGPQGTLVGAAPAPLVVGVFTITVSPYSGFVVK